MPFEYLDEPLPKLPERKPDVFFIADDFSDIILCCQHPKCAPLIGGRTRRPFISTYTEIVKSIEPTIMDLQIARANHLARHLN